MLELTTARVLRGVATEVFILLVVGWTLRVRGWNWQRLTARPSWLDLVTGTLLFLAYYFLYVTVSLVVAALAPSAMKLTTMRMIPSAHWTAMILFIVVNSLFEESIVTGYVVTALSKQGAPLAITASTLLRLLYHLYQGPVASLSILPLGLLFAGVYWRSRNLWPLFAAHTLANLAAFAASSA